MPDALSPFPSTALTAPTPSIALPTKAAAGDFDALIADIKAAPASPAAPVAGAVLLTVDPPPLAGLAPEITDPPPADPPSPTPELARPAPRQPRAATGKTLPATPPAQRAPRESIAPLPAGADEADTTAEPEADTPKSTVDGPAIAPPAAAPALVPADRPEPPIAAAPPQAVMPASGARLEDLRPPVANAPATDVILAPVAAPARGGGIVTALDVSLPVSPDAADALARSSTRPATIISMPGTPTLPVARGGSTLPAAPVTPQDRSIPSPPGSGTVSASAVTVAAALAAPPAAQLAPVPATAMAPAGAITASATPPAPPPTPADARVAAVTRNRPRDAIAVNAPVIQRSAVPGTPPVPATDRLLRARPNTAFAEPAMPPDPAATAMPSSAAPAPATGPTEPSAVATRPIDTQAHEWRTQMFDRIERFAAAEPVHGRETHIRLSPDALGEVAVRLRETDRGIEVVLDAAPEARAMLAEAAPRLAELAESRGLRLTMGQPGAGEGSGDRPPPQPRQQNDAPIPNRRAAQRGAADTPTDERIA